MLSKLSIKQLLLIAFLLAGLLPAILVSFLSFYQSRNLLKQEITRDMQTVSAAVANDIEHMMFERLQNVHTWSQLAIMQEIKVGDIDKRLSTILRGLESSYGNIYKSIYVTNLNDYVIASSQAKEIGQIKQRSPNWFVSQLDNKNLSVAKLEDSKLAISGNVLNEDNGELMGRLVVEFNWKTINDVLNSAVMESTAASLIDQKGKVIATSANWNVVNAKHGIAAKSELGQQLQVSGWQVEIEKIREVAVAPVHRLGYIFLGLLLAVLLFAMALVRPIAQAITEPLIALTDYVKKYTQNNQTKPPQSGPREVQALGRAFETMTEDLEASQLQLTKAAKLAVVGEMAAAMSHEVRTPLGILRSSTDILKREKQLSDEGKEVLTFIGSETERLNKLVSTLIDAARPRLPNFIETNINLLITDVVSMLSAQADAKNVQLTYDRPAMPVNAEVDSDQMTQVLLNLILNAVQVLVEGGKVTVKLTQGNGQAKIEVIDDGKGISAVDQNQIFEPFFTKRAGGVGLGLAVVRQIVQAHNGDIHYQDSEKNGAHFIVALPLKQQ